MSKEPIKYAKYIPPNIEFKGDITKMKIVTKIKLGYAFTSRPMIFKGYLVIQIDKGLSFYNQNTYKLIYTVNFAEGEEEILGLTKLDDDTLIITNENSAKIVRFFENEPKKITYEVIQEIKDTEYYYHHSSWKKDIHYLNLLYVGHHHHKHYEHFQFLLFFYINYLY